MSKQINKKDCISKWLSYYNIIICLVVRRSKCKFRSAGLSTLVFVVESTHWLFVLLGLFLVHGLKLSCVDLLLCIGNHLKQLLLSTIPFYLCPLPFIYLLAISFQFLLAIPYLFIQLFFPRLLFLQLALQWFILSFEFLSLLNDTVHALAYTLHLLFETLSLLFFCNCGLELGFEGLELLLMARACRLNEEK